MDIDEQLTDAIKSAVSVEITRQLKKVVLTGEHIKGGIIKEFGSTGIDDQATDIQLSILDDATVFENCLVASSADIKGDVVINGNLKVQGGIVNKELTDELVKRTSVNVQESLDDNLFEEYSSMVHKQITKDGIDLSKIMHEGRTLIKNNQLGYHIVDSNLQRVGMLNDLQTSGESFLSQTLMVVNKRVGINTMDPSSALTVWDQEVEIVTEKRQKDVGYIGTKRQQMMILGSNNNENVILHDTGAVTINSLIVGKAKMSSTENSPVHDAPKGIILWNENPELGSPIGWVSLGGAKWCSFGWLE
jgi:hypothetical protein